MENNESINTKRPRCYNCNFSGSQFKISNLTHLHCRNEELYPEEKWEIGELSPWDSLRKFSDSCDKHEFKELAIK